MDILEYELFTRFNNLGGNSDLIKIRSLEKDIRTYLKNAKKASTLLIEVLVMLELFKIDNEFSNFEYYAKITKTYSIAAPIVMRLKYVEKDDLSPTDLVISQLILGFISDIEEAQKLCEKSLAALKEYMSESPDYKKAKFFYHYNMLDRALKAEFFEVDHDREVDRRKMVKTLFKSHFNKASEIFEDKNSNVPKIYGYILNVRAAIMDRDSQYAVDNLDTIKSLKERKIYDLVRVELAEYSFYPNFEPVEDHLNIAIGVRIRKLRERLGITISELAQKLGIASESNLSLVERGDIGLTVAKLTKVADIFGVTLEELCFGINNRPRNPLTKEEFKYSKF